MWGLVLFVWFLFGGFFGGDFFVTCKLLSEKNGSCGLKCSENSVGKKLIFLCSCFGEKEDLI